MSIAMTDIDGYVDIHLAITASPSVEKYPAKQHARRVAAKLGVKQGLIYLPGQATRMLPDSDQAVAFRQLRYFYYLTGVDHPDCFVTYDVGEDLLVLYITLVKPLQAVWFGPGLGIEEAKLMFDVDDVKSVDELQGDLVSWINTPPHSQIYILHPSQKPSLPSDLHHPTHPIDSTSLQPSIDACRMLKDPHELALLRHANSIAAAAHTAILHHLSTFTNERQAQAIFEDVCTSAGVTSQSYNVIAGSGPNAAVLHYMANSEEFGDRQLLLVDAGPDWHCYASDVTRTFPISGRWGEDGRAKAIYDLVDEMQMAVIARLRPGVRYVDMQNLATSIAVLGLQELGVFRAGHSVADIIKSGAARIFFPHGLGHHVGLEVHDVSAHPINGTSTGSTTTLPPHQRFTAVPPVHLMDAVLLEENMVITVEPGIYFSSIALEQLVDEGMRGFIDLEVARGYLGVGGVRIEDDVLITGGGCEVLTTAPKGEEACRIIRGED